MEVRSNGILLNNWSATFGYVRAEDASGNWEYLGTHRGLDPGLVWKLEADFEPRTNFANENLATVALPAGPSTITTNIMNVPVTISWDGYWIDATIQQVRCYIGVTKEARARQRLGESLRLIGESTLLMPFDDSRRRAAIRLFRS